MDFTENEIRSAYLSCRR